MKKVFFSFVVAALLLLGGCRNSVDLERADITLHQIFTHYDAGYNSLFNETFPYREDGRAVLAFKLFETTGDYEFFERGQEIYLWTKETLQDKTDYLYFDNIDLEGKIDKR